MRRPGRGQQEGMASLEVAICLPALVVVAALAASGLGVVVAQLRMDEAARAATRLAMRGEPVSVAEAAAHRIAPQAKVQLRLSGQEVRTTIERTVSAPGAAGRVITFDLSSSASGIAER